MERVAAYVEGVDLGIADLDALLVGSLIENAFDFQSRLGRGCGDQLDDGGAALQWPAAPVLRDVAEQAMLDLVPLGRAWRIVADLDGHLQLVGELLQFALPQASAHIVGAAAVRRDRQLAHIAIALASDLRDPGADRSDRKLGGVVRDAEADPAGIGGGIVDAVGNDLAFLFILEVVHVDVDRAPLGPVVGAAVPEVTDQLLLLGVYGDHRLAGRLRRLHLRVDVLELRVSVGMARSLGRLAIDLARIRKLVDEQPADRVRAHVVALCRELVRQLFLALGDPHQRTHRIAHRQRLDKVFEVFDDRAVGLCDRTATTTLAPNATGRERRGAEGLYSRANAFSRDCGGLCPPPGSLPTPHPRPP